MAVVFPRTNSSIIISIIIISDHVNILNNANQYLYLSQLTLQIQFKLSVVQSSNLISKLIYTFLHSSLTHFHAIYEKPHKILILPVDSSLITLGV